MLRALAGSGWRVAAPLQAWTGAAPCRSAASLCCQTEQACGGEGRAVPTGPDPQSTGPSAALASTDALAGEVRAPVFGRLSLRQAAVSIAPEAGLRTLAGSGASRVSSTVGQQAERPLRTRGVPFGRETRFACVSTRPQHGLMGAVLTYDRQLQSRVAHITGWRWRPRPLYESAATAGSTIIGIVRGRACRVLLVAAACVGRADAVLTIFRR
jgi:hypothetical protein